MYTKFDDFFEYYIGVVQKQVPDYEDLLNLPSGHTHIHPKLTPLTKKQVDDLNLLLRIIIKVPEPVMLVYDRTASTFYSTFDKNKNRYLIGYPTCTYYMQDYPSIIKAAMKHEMGHILNKDAFADRDRAHADCTNRCMDARINIHIPHEEMDYLTRCLFAFKNTPGVRYINADHFYKQLHLPPSPGGYSWETAHEVYHESDKEPNDDDDDGTPGGDPGGDPVDGDGTEDGQREIEDIEGGFPEPIPDGDDEDEDEDNGGGGGGDDEEEGGDDEGEPGGKGGKPKDKDKDKDKGKDKDKDGDDGNEPGGDSPEKKAKDRIKMKKLDAQIQKSIKALEILKQKY